MQTKTYLSGIGGLTLLMGSGVIFSLFATNPQQVGPIGVTVWFIALLLAAAGSMSLLLFGLKSYFHIQESQRQRLLSSWRQGLLLGTGGTVILGLRSLRQLALRDMIIIAIMLALIEIYFRTRS